MQLNLSNKLVFLVIDKKYDASLIKSFVLFNKKFNSDDGFYLINDNYDLYSPSYSNALILQYPFKKHTLSYLLKDAIKSIKNTEDDDNRYLIIITDNKENIDIKTKDNLNQLNIKCLIKSEIDLEVMNFCFKGSESD